MITNKKGISPLIATVLIVGFTIILAVIVVNFVLNTTEKQTQIQECVAEAEQKCLGFVGSDRIDIQASADSSSVSVTNLGSSTARFVVSWIDGTSGTTTETLTITGPVNVGSSITVSFTTGTPTGNDRIRAIAVVDGPDADGDLSPDCQSTCTSARGEVTL